MCDLRSYEPVSSANAAPLRVLSRLKKSHAEALRSLRKRDCHYSTSFMPDSASQFDHLFSTLAGWTALAAPTGFEELVLQRAHDELSHICDRVEVDVRGNVYAWQKGSDQNAPLVMLTAHADEIGFMVTHVRSDGFLRFDKLGHPTDQVLPGQRVRVLGSNGPIEAVIGVKPGHILSSEESRRVPLLNDLYIDVGVDSADEVAALGIEVGTPAVFVGELTRTANSSRCIGKSVDNRIGLVCLLEVAQRLKTAPPKASVCYVVTVEEEIGLRGAFVAAQRVEPDVVIAIDTVPSGGTPDLRSDELSWTIGAGPLLKVRESKGLSTHPKLRELMRSVAKEQQIPVQLIVDTAGITDATSAQQANGNIAAMTIGLARRYSHSAVEMLDLRDAVSAIELVAQTVQRIERKEDLLRV